MIAYPQFDFATAPRTGSAWFVQVAAIVGLGEQTRAHVHEPHRQAERLRVSHVRHPCTWLQSYYTTVYPAYLAVPCVDVFRSLPGKTFDEFVTAYLRRIPGQITAMFESYNANTIYRLEDQPHAFIELMQIIGVDYDSVSIWRHTAANRSIASKPVWNRMLWDRVIDAERKMVEDFDYGKSIDRYPGTP